MGSDTDAGGDDKEIFDDILPFQSWNQETGPGLRWQYEQRHDRGDHVQEEQRYHDAFGTADLEGADFRACQNYGPLYGLK